MALNYFEMNENESKILQFLARKRWYGQAMITELGREFKKSWNTISTAAKSLEKKGLIERDNGSLKIVKDNKANYHFKMFIDHLSILSLDEKARNIISDTYSHAESVANKAGSRLLSLVVFGSTASGEAEKESDIDLLIILEGPEKKEELEKLKGEVISKRHIEFGNINIIVMDKKEFEAGYLDADDLIVGILSNNLIFYDDGFLWVFMQRELFMPSRKTIFIRTNQLEKNKEKLLELIKLNDNEKLKEEFYNYLINEARIELLRKKTPAITKKDAISKIAKFNKELYAEIMDIDKGDIKKKVLDHVSR
ncbi:hypothetical protein COV19_02860 [Candidatus Woesearchaeota archaeon CG10_big_fil_rev_8_21_14_0_10_44_13]|nr:MAG: hypothetical protein COV19_02860 [Candidatus Woesearchaeota archaeon CG10_big_fil_rev_8_21_14_0_10_44_13]